MKALFINPPTWFNMFPPLALPIIAGYLESTGNKATVMDLNIEFFHYLFSDEFQDKFIATYKTLQNEVFEYREKNTKDITPKNDNIIKKCEIYDYISDYISTRSYDVLKSKQYCNEYKNIVSNIDRYFNAWDLKIYHYKTIIMNEIILKLQTVYNDLIQDFIDESVKKIIDFNADYIGFSMSDVDQFFYSIKLAKLIKKETNTLIVFGGTCINYFYDKKITDKINFHKQIADFVIFGAGEFSNADIAEYIEGKKAISEIRNVEYLGKDGVIKRNKMMSGGVIPKYITKYNDLDLSKYFTPKMVLSIETTKGCYWHKCAFCTRPTLHQELFQRKVSDVVDELEYLNKTYNVKYFHLMDDCIPFKFAEKLAQTIIERKLNIYYMTFLRFEEYMTKDFFQKLYESGLRLVIWGLESPNDKRLKYINKGTNSKTAKRILKETTEIGIKNNVTLIIDYPNETETELQNTLSFIEEYADEMYFPQIHQFQLIEGSNMYNNPKKFGISNDLTNRARVSGYAKNTLSERYENIREDIDIYSMKRGAPPNCLYTTGGSLLYAMRDEILAE